MKQPLFRTLPYALSFAALTLFSCERHEPLQQHDDVPLTTPTSHSISVRQENGIVSLNSTNDLEQLLKTLAADESLTVTATPMTKSDTSDFVSLRQSLIDQGLRSFTDEELAMIQAEGLIYEPEDSLIKDPYLISVLNQDREIKIGQKIYRFIPKGVLVYEASSGDSVFVPEITYPIEHGKTYPINDNSSLIGIDYGNTMYDDGSGPDKPQEFYDDVIGGGYRPPVNDDNDNSDPVVKRSRDINLMDGINIPSYDIRRVSFVNGKGEDDSNWLDKFGACLFGSNIVAVNHFDDRHRMRLNMYAQDYIICHSVGMKVRMQKRVLGIWWRKKAEEFRYGWSNIECKYTFKNPAPLIPDTTPHVLSKSQGYKRDSGVDLFYVPSNLYNTKSGYIEDVLNEGMADMEDIIKKWGDYKKGFDNNAQSIYTIVTDEDGMHVLVVYPQGEETAYNTGKEKVVWGYDWFRGRYTFASLYDTEWKFESLDLTPNKEIEILRGRIYAAVKYNGKWKACIIETKTTE